MVPRPRNPSVQNYTVFQTNPPRGLVSIYDAREAFALAKTTRRISEKEAIYECMGIDRYRTEKYLAIVEDLNRIYRRTDTDAIISKILNLMKRKGKRKGDGASEPFLDQARGGPNSPELDNLL